jgi:hypothetical protein
MSSVCEERNEEEEKVPPGIESPKVIDKLYRKKFDFLYRRTSFRVMAEFYKYLFASFVKTKKVQKHLKSHITNFTATVFG